MCLMCKKKNILLKLKNKTYNYEQNVFDFLK